MTSVFKQKRLKTLEAKADFISQQFAKSDDDHPFIWRQYVVGDIKNHAEIGGYQTVCELSYRLRYFLTVFVDPPWCFPV
jgi:hypothetical protein